MKPDATHCARSWPITKCRLRSGTATLMMVEDMMAAMDPVITANSSNQR